MLTIIIKFAKEKLTPDTIITRPQINNNTKTFPYIAALIAYETDEWKLTRGDNDKLEPLLDHHQCVRRYKDSKYIYVAYNVCILSNINGVYSYIA